MIKGKLVGLRAVEKKDLEQLRKWRNNPEFRKFFREVNEINKENQEKWYYSVTDKNTENKMFSIVSLETGELLGACGLCYIDWVNRSADFSIYLGYKGLYIDDKYAVDSAEVLKCYGFDIMNLHRLWAEVYSIDEKKIEFFPKIGFKLDATIKETYWYDGKWNDSLFFNLIK